MLGSQTDWACWLENRGACVLSSKAAGQRSSATCSPGAELAGSQANQDYPLEVVVVQIGGDTEQYMFSVPMRCCSGLACCSQCRIELQLQLQHES